MPDTGLNPSDGQFATHRHLAVVLLQLGRARTRLASADKRLQEISDSDPDKEAQEERYARADKDVDNLEAEARGMIASATGVPFDIIAEAGL